MKPMMSCADMTDEQWQVAAEMFQKPPEGDVVSVQWVVYMKPKDAPNHVMVRRWEVMHGGTIRDCEAYGFKTLDDARTVIPFWATRLPHQPGEDPVIQETWI